MSTISKHPEDYRRLEMDDTVQRGDEVLGPDAHEQWEPAKHGIGRRVPDPQFPAHCHYRRKISCAWTPEENHGYYDASCGHAYVFDHEFTVGGAYAFCPGCGQPIRLCPPTPEPLSVS